MLSTLPENNRWRDFNWRKDRLFILDSDTGLKIIPDSVHPEMYRVVWPDGEISADFYNLTMAKENARTIASQL